MMIKGNLHLSAPIVKRFSAENFLSRQNGSQKWRFFEKIWGLNVRFYFFKLQKAHPCAKPRLLKYLREG